MAGLLYIVFSSALERCGAFGGGKFAPSSGSLQKTDVGEGYSTDAPAHQAQGRVADGRGHAADLAIFAFMESQGQPRVGDVFAKTHRRIARWKGGGLGFGEAASFERSAGVVGEFHAGGEAGEGVVGGDAFDQHPVFAFVGVLRVEELGVEPGFVGEQEQALAVGVETAKRVDARRQFRREVGEGFPRGTGLGGELREDAVGFVKRDEHGNFLNRE